MLQFKLLSKLNLRRNGTIAIFAIVASILVPSQANAAITGCDFLGTTITGPVGSPITPTSAQTISGASGTLTFTASPALPAGLAISSTGVISGTPSAVSTATNATYAITVTDSSPTPLTANCGNATVSIFNISGVSSINTSVNNFININPSIQGTTPAVTTWTWTLTDVTGGNIGADLSIFNGPGGNFQFNPTTGSLIGTPTKANPTRTYKLSAASTLGTVTSSNFTITVNAVATGIPNSYTGPVGTAITPTTLTVSGFTPTTCSISSSAAVPSWLTCSTTLGVVTISGTPNAALPTQSFIAQASDGTLALTASFSITINANTALSTPSGFVATPGNSTAIITWSSVANATSGYTVTINPVTGSATCTQPITNTPTTTCSNLTNGTSYTVSVYANATITYAASAAGTSGTFVPSSVQLATPTNLVVVPGNASAVLTWSPVVSALGYTITTSPASTCTFNGSLLAPSASCTGLANGTLTAVYVVATATGASNSSPATQTFTPAAGTITPAYQTLEFVRGVAITPTTTFTSTGLTGTITYTLAGTLPTGLVFNTSTGVISGTPLITQTPAAFIVTATGSTGGSASATIVIRSKPGITPATQTLTPAQGVLMSPSTLLTAVDFTSAPTFTVSPTLPAGLTINPATGVISGTALVTSPVTTYTITGVDSASNIATTSVVLSVIAGGTISPLAQALSLTQGLAMNPSATFVATGFTGSITYTVTPTLPIGLSLNPANGSIFGTPNSIQGAITYVITASGATAGRASSNVVITISAPVGAISPSSLTLSLMRGVAMTASQTFSATGFSGAITYSITPNLPTGLSLNSLNGSISGTPSVEQASTSYVLSARGSTSGAASANIVIAVMPGVNPPSTVAATYVAGKVTVTWTASTGALSYRVTSLPIGPVCVVNGLSASCTELTPGTNYQFMVQAINSANVVSINAAFSNEISIPTSTSTATKKYTFYYGYKSTQLDVASFNALYTFLSNLKSSGKKNITVKLIGYVPAKSATALDKKTALARAVNIKNKLSTLGLSDLVFSVSNSGKSSVTGVKARRIDITISYLK